MEQHVIFEEKDSQKCFLKIKIMEKLETIVILQINTDMQHIVYVTLDLMFIMKLLQFFQNESNYDYHFIMKELANEFGGQFECLWENTDKYKTIFRSNVKRNQES